MISVALFLIVFIHSHYSPLCCPINITHQYSYHPNAACTYTHKQIAHGKPFYVASESYKFARLYPLNQQDLPAMGNNSPIEFVDTTRKKGISQKEGEEKEQHQKQNNFFDPVYLPENVRVENSPCDFTPAKFITLLFTDLGVLTPSAVSDELIRLYQ